MPLGVPHAHDVAAGEIGDHRRIEHGLVLQKFIQERVPLLAAARVDLIPQARHLPEAVLLVVVIELERPRLNGTVLEQRFEDAVIMRHRAQAQADGIAGIHAAHAHLIQVCHGPQAQLLRFAQQRFHDLGIHGAQLETVDAFTVGPAHPFAGGFGRSHRRIGPSLAGERPVIGENPRRGDLVPRAALAFAQRPIHVACRHAAHGGNAVAHPELMGILRVGSLGRATGVNMQIDKAGHGVHPGSIDFACAARRPARVRYRNIGISDGSDFPEAIPFDHDIDRPARRRAGAVDHGDAANDEALEWTFALPCTTVRRRIDR